MQEPTKTNPNGVAETVVRSMPAFDYDAATNQYNDLLEQEQGVMKARQKRYDELIQQYNKPRDDSEKWLRLASSLSKPTRTGTLGEEMGNAAGSLAESKLIERKQNLEDMQRKYNLLNSRDEATTDLLKSQREGILGPQEKIAEIKKKLAYADYMKNGGSKSTSYKPREVAVGKDAAGNILYQTEERILNPETSIMEWKNVGILHPKGRVQVGNMTPDAVTNAALLDIVTPGKGKVSGGTAVAALNTQIQNRKAEILDEIGSNAGDIVTKPAEFHSLGKSLDNQDKAISMMNSYISNMGSQISRYNELSDELFSFDKSLLNSPLRFVRGKLVGSPLQSKLDTLIEEVTREISKVSEGSVASVRAAGEESMAVWRKIHDPNLSVAKMKDLLSEIKHLGEMRQQSIQTERGNTVGKMRSLVSNPKSKTTEGKPTLESIFK